MKNTFLSLRIFLGVILTVLLTACQKQESAVPYYQIIPEEAYNVFSVKVNQIVEKAGGDQNIVSFLALFQKQLDQDIVRQLEVILKNGREYGLNLEENLYIFSESLAGRIGVVAKVSEYTKTEKALKDLGFTVETDAKGYRHAVLNQRLVCYFNESVLLCITTLKGISDIDSYAAGLMNLSPENSLSRQEGFAKLRSSAEDIAFLTKNQLAGEDYMLFSPEINLSKVEILGGIHFEKGLINAYCSYFTTDRSVQDQLSEKYKFLRKEKNVLADLYPASALLYMSTNLNGPKIAENVDKWNIRNQQQKADLQKMLSALDGECALGYLNISPIGIPSVLLYAEVGNNYPLEYIIQLVEREFGNFVQVRKTGNDRYEINVTMVNMNVYTGIKKGLFYITNDNSVYKNVGEKVADPLRNSPYFTRLANSYIGAFMNVESIIESPLIQLSLSQWKHGAGTLILQLLSECNSIEVCQESPEKAILRIHLQNKEQNSLKTLLEAARK